MIPEENKNKVIEIGKKVIKDLSPNNSIKGHKSHNSHNSHRSHLKLKSARSHSLLTDSSNKEKENSKELAILFNKINIDFKQIANGLLNDNTNNIRSTTNNHLNSYKVSEAFLLYDLFNKGANQTYFQKLIQFLNNVNNSLIYH